MTNGVPELGENASPGRSKEDSEVLRDIARRCRTIGLAVAGADRQRILGYALELEKVAANSDVAGAEIASRRSRRRLLR